MTTRIHPAWAAVAVLALPVFAHAQQPAAPPVAPPANQPTLPKEQITAPVTPAPSMDEPSPTGGSVPWNSDRITSDSQLVGSYNQPVWTTQRPFTTTRAYVIPEGTIALEQWYRPRWHRDGTREDRLLEEIEIGLPCRFQLDLYERWHIQPDDNNHYNAFQEGIQVELRWAVANWGVIPLNPTAYLEYVQGNEKEGTPDKYELKLLLADSFFNGKVYFAANPYVEKEIGGEKENEIGYTQAIGMTIIERKLLAGVEMIFRAENVHGDRGTWANEFLIGPSMQYRFTNRAYLDVTGLFGVTKAAPTAEMYVIFGYQFGKRAGPSSGYSGITPTSIGN